MNKYNREHSDVRERSLSAALLQAGFYGYVAAVSLLCLLPFYIMIINSFASEHSLVLGGFRLVPKEFSINAYKAIFSNPDQIGRAYAVTVSVTAISTILGLFIMAMAAYVLQRQDFRQRNTIAFLIYFPTLFSGGLIPWYILIVRYLHLKDSYWALILPGLIGAFNIILLRNFVKGVPESITESAKVDGAGDFLIFIRLILPLIKPGLATIGLFLTLGHWNDWFTANTFLTSENKIPLQLLLMRMLRQAEFYSSELSASLPPMEVPSETLKMAMAVVVTGPIILMYPFVQKYFVKGITIGAVKG